MSIAVHRNRKNTIHRNLYVFIQTGRVRGLSKTQTSNENISARTLNDIILEGVACPEDIDPQHT